MAVVHMMAGPSSMYDRRMQVDSEWTPLRELQSRTLRVNPGQEELLVRGWD